MESLVFIVFAVLAVAGAIYQYYRGQQRKTEIQALAQRLGWRFDPSEDSSLDSRYEAFTCLSQGSSRYAYNLLEGAIDGRELLGFDYHYETYSTDSKGNRTTHHHYFSAVVVETGLPLKPLFIRPETIFDKVAEFFGFDDVDFESDKFNREFCVKAADRHWAFDVLHQATMEFLLAAPRFNLQFAGSRVMATRNSLFNPPEFEQAVQVISGIIDRLPDYLLREIKGVEQ